MMTGVDEWGRDPAVRTMRKVFKAMEDSQRELFDSMGIYYYDPRIRLWREMALHLSEKAFSFTGREGFFMNENTASNMYLHCLAHVMTDQGIDVPGSYLPEPTGIEDVLKEIL